jgi:hypothetical protein
MLSGPQLARGSAVVFGLDPGSEGRMSILEK